MRIVGIIAGVLLLAGIVIAVLLVRNLDSLVADAIETHGSRAAGTAVSVDSVEIRLREGRGTIRGLTVANPEGFSQPHALTWDEVSIDIDPASIPAPPYVLEEVRIEAPEVTLVVDERGRVNLRELQQRIQGRQEPEAEPSSGEAPRLKIRSLTFERGKVAVHTAEVGGRDAGAELPPLHLQDLGGAAGAAPATIGREVLAAYTEQVLQTVARRELGRQLDQVIDEQLGGEAGEAAKGMLDRLRGS